LIAAGQLERSTGDRAASLALAEEARGLAKEIGIAGAESKAAQDVLVQADRLVAFVLFETGAHDDALEAIRNALAIRQKEADAAHGDLSVHASLADILFDGGQLLARAGLHAEAINYLVRREEVWTKLSEKDLALPVHRRRLTLCRIDTVMLLLRLGHASEARARCERAVAEYESLVGVSPGDIDDRLTLIKCLLRLGQAHQADSDGARAATDWRRAINLAQAVAIPSGELFFLSACCRSSIAGIDGRAISAAERDSELNLAMAFLRQAAEKGYRNPEFFRTETALDPLRGRDDFRLFMMDLAMPEDPWERK
jgi:tetratricopeptide (TPR) repeat protein